MKQQTGLALSSSRVIPPKIHSPRRLWPYAPTTIRSALRSRANPIIWAPSDSCVSRSTSTLALISCRCKKCAKRYSAAREELVTAEMIRFDAENSIVMVERWFKHNPPTSEDHLKGIERLLQRLAASPLQEASQQCAVEAWAAFCSAKQAKDRGKGMAVLAPPAHANQAASLARMETPYLNRGGR